MTGVHRPSLRFSSRRRGIGVVLIVGVCFLLVMAVMGLAQSMLASQVTDAASRSSLGRLALLVTESAAAEARLALAKRANEPGTDLYRRVRDIARDGSSAGKSVAALTLKLDRDLPRTAGLLASQELANFELEGGGVEVSVAFVRTLLPRKGDYEALAEISCAARFKLDLRVRRTFTETVALRVNRIALPPPLGSAAVLVRSPARILEGSVPGDQDNGAGLDVNDAVSKLLFEQFPEITSAHAAAMAKVGDPEARELPFVKEIYPYYARIGGEVGEIDYLGAVEMYKTSLAPLPPFPEDPEKTLAVSRFPEIGLESVNLQGWVVPRADALGKIALEVQAKQKELDAAIAAQDGKSDAVDPRITQLNKDYALLLATYLVELEDLLAGVQSFKTSMRLVHKDGPGKDAELYRALNALFAEVESEQLKQPVNFWSERATHVLGEDKRTGDQRRTITQRLDTLLGEVGGPERRLNGVIYVNNPDEVLTLKGEYSGKLVIVATGDCVIDGARAKGPDDLLTIVANGKPKGRITVSGEIVASLVLNGLKLSVDPETSIEGTVILNDIAPKHALEIGGHVRADPRLADVDGDAYWHVIVSPWTRTRSVVRS